MALSFKTLQYLMYIFSVLIFVGGIATFVAGICWLLKVKIFSDIFEKHNEILAATLMIAGALSAVMTFLGCVGTSKRIVSSLVVYAMLLFFVLIGSVTAIVFAFVKISWFDKKLEDNAKPEPFQIYFAAFMGGMCLIELITVVFASLIVRKIEKANTEEDD